MPQITYDTGCGYGTTYHIILCDVIDHNWDKEDIILYFI